MSKKAKLINIFKTFKTEYESVQSKVTGIRNSESYTEEGKQQECNAVLDAFAGTVRQYHDQATAIINDGMQALDDSWNAQDAKHLNDGAYQAGLSNVIKMLELDAVKDVGAIKNIINNYSSDPTATEVIRALLAKSSDEDVRSCASFIAVNNREESKRLLIQLRNNIDKYISIAALKNMAVKAWNKFNSANTSDVITSLDSMTDFVNTRLNDDLSLK